LAGRVGPRGIVVLGAVDRRDDRHVGGEGAADGGAVEVAPVRGREHPLRRGARVQHAPSETVRFPCVCRTLVGGELVRGEPVQGPPARHDAGGSWTTAAVQVPRRAGSRAAGPKCVAGGSFECGIGRALAGRGDPFRGSARRAPIKPGASYSAPLHVGWAYFLTRP